MSGARLLIWDFDGTLAHRRGETGWSILLAETLDAQEPGHPHSADTFRPYLRSGFPWHEPEIAHPELCEPDAWWAAVEPVLGRAYEAAGYEPARALELAGSARRLYVDPNVGWELFDDTLPALERLSQAGWTHAILSNHVPELRQIVTALGTRRGRPVPLLLGRDGLREAARAGVCVGARRAAPGRGVDDR